MSRKSRAKPPSPFRYFNSSPEVMRRGVAVDPRSVSMSRIVSLSGGAMRAFRAKFAGLLGARVTAGR